MKLILPEKKMLATEMAYSTIRNAIINGELRPGYPILETEFSVRLGVSRTPIREAINRLKAEDLIETIRRKGIFVKALSIDDLCKKYEIAEGLEGMVAYLVASDPEIQIKELEGSIQRMEQALIENHTDDWVTADKSYHATLSELCKNGYLVKNLKQLNEKLNLARLLLIARSAPDKNQSTKEHRATLEAIIAGDADMARAITQNHWRRVRKSYQNLI